MAIITSSPEDAVIYSQRSARWAKDDQNAAEKADLTPANGNEGCRKRGATIACFVLGFLTLAGVIGTVVVLRS